MDYIIFEVKCRERLNEIISEDIEINVFGEEVAADKLLSILNDSNFIDTYDIDEYQLRENLLQIMDYDYKGEAMYLDRDTIIQAVYNTIGFTEDIFLKSPSNHVSYVKRNR